MCGWVVTCSGRMSEVDNVRVGSCNIYFCFHLQIVIPPHLSDKIQQGHFFFNHTEGKLCNAQRPRLRLSKVDVVAQTSPVI